MTELRVKKEHFVDTSEQDDKDYWDYYYSYFIYTFSFKEKDREIIVRRHGDDDEEAEDVASFNSYRYWRKWKRRMCDTKLFQEIPDDDPLFQSAAEYLINQAGVRNLKILLSESDKPYMPIDFSNLSLEPK
jgi:hypothetical protein